MLGLRLVELILFLLQWQWTLIGMIFIILNYLRNKISPHSSEAVEWANCEVDGNLRNVNKEGEDCANLLICEIVFEAEAA